MSFACSVAVQVEGLRGALKDVEATKFQRCRILLHSRQLLSPIVLLCFAISCHLERPG